MISRFRRDLVLDVIQDHVQTGLKCNCSSVCGGGGGRVRVGGGKEESLKIQIVRRKKLIHSKCANI